ncbi:hypothetical protein ACFQ3N_07425 [Virgibacillus byunsanensis]|uniref:Uncharacterized protein n=1 Tax=Virgibacillus byunsanensis TaxID=570945 RepID=A0ABW3LL69_9BACI
MSYTLIFILGIFAIQSISILFFVTYYRMWISKMNGMIISMALGMTTGILIGTILGVVLHGNLFESTVYSIIIGFTIGFIAGIPFGLLAVIDGTLSGLMGGMMGAMLGEMVAMSNPDAMIRILSLIVTMTLLLVLYTADNSIRKESNKSIFPFLNYPFWLLFIIALVYLGLN